VKDPEHPLKVSRTPDKCTVQPFDGRQEIHRFTVEKPDIIRSIPFCLFPGEINRFFPPVNRIDP
jgi:hypothetical protein